MENNSPETDSQPFTDKELEVIQPLLDGKSTQQIALQLGISTRAVEHHLTHIYEKLDVCSRAEAIIKLIHLFEKQQSSGIRS
jgi:DNA-binding NarL/FixJ family response regulator